MLAQEAFNPPVVAVGLGEQPLESLGPQVLTNPEDVSVATDHFPENALVSADCRVLLQEGLEQKVVLDLVFNVFLLHLRGFLAGRLLFLRE